MRVNVYAEEITLDVRPQEEKVREDSGRAYNAVRFYLHSSDRLHHDAKDDDRSAITFWGKKALLKDLFKKALETLGD
jgi:hypothetical protein